MAKIKPSVEQLQGLLAKDPTSRNSGLRASLAALQRQLENHANTGQYRKEFVERQAREKLREITAAHRERLRLEAAKSREKARERIARREKELDTNPARIMLRMQEAQFMAETATKDQLREQLGPVLSDNATRLSKAVSFRDRFEMMAVVRELDKRGMTAEHAAVVGAIAGMKHAEFDMPEIVADFEEADRMDSVPEGMAEIVVERERPDGRTEPEYMPVKLDQLVDFETPLHELETAS